MLHRACWEVAMLLALAAAALAQKPAKSGECPPGYIPRPDFSTEVDGPPVLRRGVPEEYERGAPDEVVTCIEADVVSEVSVSEDGTASASIVAPPGYDEFLVEAGDKALAFSESLPNFICTQLVYRFESRTRPADWKLQDRVSVEVLMVDGTETYQNARRNGKPVGEDKPSDTGQWSRGEFGSLMQDLFSDLRRVQFKFVQNDEIAGKLARRYDYSIEQPDSHWRVVFEGREIYPAYEGQIWISPEQMRVLRIEMVAVDIPSGYPMDVIEMTVDYGPVRIAEREYVLPTRSENLACIRGSVICSRNEIEFHNYNKFEAETVITTTDSSIEFGDPVEQ